MYSPRPDRMHMQTMAACFKMRRELQWQEEEEWIIYNTYGTYRVSGKVQKVKETGEMVHISYNFELIQLIHVHFDSADIVCY